MNDTIVSGIYKIVNKVNGKYYVGSSSNINVRWKSHVKELNGGYHHNNHLQRSWKEYGYNNFEFIVIKTNVSNDKLLSEEQIYLDVAKSEKHQSYNSTFIAGRVEMTVETRAKIGVKALGHKRNVGRKYSVDTVNKRRKSRSWYKEHSLETRRKISEKALGRTVSDETKDKISKSLRGSIPHNIDNTILTFSNCRSGEKFIGTKNDFIKTFKLFKQPVYAIINKTTRLKTYKGWSVTELVE